MLIPLLMTAGVMFSACVDKAVLYNNSMSFDECIDIILSQEGGYTNNPADPGGETNFGISKRFYPELDIKNLTKEEAKKIYKSHYWDPIKGDSLPEEIRLIVLDAAVNQGINFAIKALDECVKRVSVGIMTPETLSMLALESMSDNILEIKAKFAIKRLERYSRLPTWDSFGKGWSMRLLKIALN